MSIVFLYDLPKNTRALQESFWDRIQEEREHELGTLWKSFVVAALNSFLLNSIPVIVAVATFGTYVLLGNNITASQAFTALSLLNVRPYLSFTSLHHCFCLVQPVSTMDCCSMEASSWVVFLSVKACCCCLTGCDKALIVALYNFENGCEEARLMQVLRLPLFQLPQLITQLVNAQVSIKRIEEFLAAPKSDPLEQLPAAAAGT